MLYLDSLFLIKVSTSVLGQLFIFPIMNLIYSLERDFHILQRVYKRHQLLDRRIELTYNILYRQHCSKSHVTVYYRRSCKHCYCYVLNLVDENTPGFL